MKRERRFLSAEWKNIAMLNYAVDPALLEAAVPRGTELDEFGGKAYISLIGFNFNRTKLLGIAVPFHQSFEEVNVRFYVRHGMKRGAVFIKELVPKFAVAAIARLVFNENYARVPMSHRNEFGANGDITMSKYSWGADSRFSLEVETTGISFLAPDGSLSQFITEHYWGYSAQSDGGTLEYEVEHPRWRVWDAKHAAFSGDATSLYGERIAEALTHPPDSAFVAEGSAVTVSKGLRIV